MPRIATSSLPAQSTFQALATLPPISRLLINVALTLAHWDTRLRSRRALARLDDHLLQDIGLTTAAAKTECAKARWLD